jgi:two-component sensor histidine kinase
MDLRRGDREPRQLVVNAHKLIDGSVEDVRLLLTVLDVTEARLAEKLKDNLVREKAILLQEVQHRVANSLQIIASVLLQSARKVQSEETRSHLANAHSRVLSIAAVQRQLAATSLGDVALAPYLIQLCQSLGASMIHDPGRLSLVARIDDSSTTADTSISIGLIVTELVINALKHAFPGERQGEITVNYDAAGSEWKLWVGDNGIGMPEDENSARPGLGTSIVEALARQLEADVEVEDAHPGTTVTIAHKAAPAKTAVRA